MEESKIELTHRLEREDRWAEASLFKDNHIAQLRAEGKTRKEAQQAAWEEMERRFPPLEVSPQSNGVEDTPTAWAEHWDTASDDYVRDAQWVYGKIGSPNVQPEDAPSPGAWSMLRWARGNEDRFFEQIMPKVMAKSSKTLSNSEGELPDEYKQDPTEIRRMLAEHHLHCEREAVSDTAKAVKDKVAAKFSGWQRRFDLEIPGEASESWTLQMIELADDLMHAALKYPEQYRNNHRKEWKA